MRNGVSGVFSSFVSYSLYHLLTVQTRPTRFLMTFPLKVLLQVTPTVAVDEIFRQAASH